MILTKHLSTQGPLFQSCIIIIFFLDLLFGCCTANFGPAFRGQPHSSGGNHCVSFRTKSHWEHRKEVESFGLTNPLGHSPHIFNMVYTVGKFKIQMAFLTLNSYLNQQHSWKNIFNKLKQPRKVWYYHKILISGFEQFLTFYQQLN